MIVVISGTAYFEAVDPRRSSVPKELGWPTPRKQNYASGYRFHYDITVEQAQQMAVTLQFIGERLVSDNGPEGDDKRVYGRAVLLAAKRVREAIRAELKRATGS